MKTLVPTPDYAARKGLCEICSNLTRLLAWNLRFHEWDFVCKPCQEELGIYDPDWEDEL